VIRREWEGAVEAQRRPPSSAKNRLQEWTLGRGLGLPEYRHLGAEGPPHAPRFVVLVRAAGREARGCGETKRAAEAAAAEAWLAEVEQ
jgi:ribonuclease-3